MNITVLKFGGSSLKDKTSLKKIAALIRAHRSDKVIVLSALSGVTDRLAGFLQRYFQNATNHSKNVTAIPALINYLKERHQELMESFSVSEDVYQSLKENLDKLERLLYGIFYTEELTEKTQDLILSFGERFSVKILEAILRDEGVPAQSFEADKIGLITDSDFGDASALLDITSKNFKKRLFPLLHKNITPIISGFFGVDEAGHTTIFGRGGSDYTASVVSYALSAKELILYKDVNGFMSADPSIVPEAHLLRVLSYDEAAELAYFGAKIIHPKTIEPLKLKSIPLIIRNAFCPDEEGTRIQLHSSLTKDVVKSVVYGKDIAVLKIYGAGVGYKPGVLQEIISHITGQGINIKSVITAQTCINILLDKENLEKSYHSLIKTRIKTVDKIEQVSNIVLIGIVGEGLIKKRGLAARVFKAVSKEGVNVEMISAGASLVAYYFIVNQAQLEKTIRAIHKEFFP
jgi:aspartate kinase